VHVCAVEFSGVTYSSFDTHKHACHPSNESQH